LSEKIRLALVTKFGVESLQNFLKEMGLYGGEYQALTESEGRTLLRAETINAARDRIVAARQKRNDRIRQESFQRREASALTSDPQNTLYQYQRDPQYAEQQAKFDAAPVVEIKGDEIVDFSQPQNFRDLWNVFVPDWAEQNGITGTYANTHTGWDNIEIRRKGIKDTMRHGASREKIQTVAALPQLIQTGIYLGQGPTHNLKQIGMTSHVFAAKIDIAGKPLVVGFVIKEDMNGRRFYDHEMLGIESLDEIVPKSGAAPSVDEGRQSESRQGLVLNIVRAHLGVKPDITFSQKNTANAPRGYVTFDSAAATAQAVITLLQNHDASTALHELWHVFRRDLEVLAGWQGAPAQVKADWETACKYVGATPGRKWTIEQEEIWARAGEAYVREGKAPSPELRGVFNRFRDWLKGIYTSVKKLNVELNDDVRAVFDRMLASDEELALIKSEAAAPVLSPEHLQKSGLNEQQARQLSRSMEAAYASMAEKADQRKRIARRQERQHWASQAKEAAEADPRQQVLAKIVESGGINREDLSVHVDEKMLAALAGKGKNLVRVDGLSLEHVAASLNMSADELLARLLDTPSRKEFIEQRIAEQEQEWDNEITALELAITDEFIATLELEAAALSGGAAVIPSAAWREAMVRQVNQAKIAALDAEAAALEAEGATLPLPRTAYQARSDDRTILAASFIKAQKTASLLARQGRRQEALKAKNQARVMAMQIREKANLRLEIKDAVRYFKRVQKSKSAADEYLQQIRQLLGRYLFAGQPLAGAKTRARAGTESLPAFVERKGGEGEELAVSPQVLYDQLPARIHAMTLEQLRDLRQAVKSLETSGRNQTKLLAARRKMTIDQAASAIAQEAGTAANAPSARQPQHSLTARVKFLEGIKRYINKITTAETLSRLMGPKFYHLIFTPLNDAANAEAAGWERLSAAMKAAWAKIPAAVRNNWNKARISFNGVYFTGEMAFMMGLNWGNSGNREAALKGYNLSLEQAGQILDTLSQEEWQAIREVAELIGGMWPALNQVQMTLTGAPLGQVEAEPFMTKFGPQPGWYFPLAGDASVNPEEVQKLHEAEQLKDQFVSPQRIAQLTKGFSKERQGGKLAPLLSFKVIYQRLADTNRYSTHAMAVRDVKKLLAHKQVRQAIAQKLGKSALEQFGPWLQHITRPGDNFLALGTADKAALRIFGNSAKAALGFSITSALMQPLGLFNAVPEVGAVRLLKNLAKVTGSYLGLSYRQNLKRILQAGGALGQDYYATHKFIENKSAYMRSRRRNLDRDVGVAALENNPKKRLYEKITSQWAFALMRFMDNFTAQSVWLAAYDQAIAQGLEEEAAVDHADSVVRRTQGSGRTIDMTDLQRGGAIAKAMTMFMTPFIASGNQLRESAQRVVWNPKDPAAWDKMGKVLFWTFLVSAAVASLLREREEWEPEDAPIYLADYIMTHLPLIREFKSLPIGLLNSALGTNQYAGSYRMMGISDMAEGIRRGSAALTEGDYLQSMQRFLRFFGPFAGIPSNQINTTLRGFDPHNNSRAWLSLSSKPVLLTPIDEYHHAF
jgi:hypothetical protein